MLGLALGPAIAGGCGGAGGGVEAPVGAPGEATDELAVVTPARWIYHPREAPTASAALPLGDGRCVVATTEGERWLVPAGKGETCGGVALGTAVGAPEGGQRRSSGGPRSGAGPRWPRSWIRSRGRRTGRRRRRRTIRGRARGRAGSNRRTTSSRSARSPPWHSTTVTAATPRCARNIPSDQSAGE